MMNFMFLFSNVFVFSPCAPSLLNAYSNFYLGHLFIIMMFNVNGTGHVIRILIKTFQNACQIVS